MVIGFGLKPDLATGRVINLDKTYEEVIAPAFKDTGVNCFRAIDVNRTGSIDKIMYYWLYHADFVIADISTLNANVMYELGVRHAQKPNTTIIIAESELFSRLPFDINHNIIHAYEHLGDAIPESTKTTFVANLNKLIKDLAKNPEESDSPVYDFLPGMVPPQWTDPVDRIKELEAALAKKENPEVAPEDQSLSVMVELAEKAKNDENYETAIALFEEALKEDPNNDFLVQRLCLVTYKSELPTKMEALRKAEAILQAARPKITTDPETLGLAGAIYKRIYEETDAMADLDQSLWYYGRGFYVKQDYYTGINLAFLHTLKSLKMSDEFDAITHFGHAKLIREKVLEICESLQNEEKWSMRGDRQWVVQTMAQAYIGLDRKEEAKALYPQIEALSKGSFDITTFEKQNRQLEDAISTFNDRIKKSRRVEKIDQIDSSEAETNNTKATVIQSNSADSINISIPNPQQRKVKSVDVNCRVEFED